MQAPKMILTATGMISCSESSSLLLSQYRRAALFEGKLNLFSCNVLSTDYEALPLFLVSIIKTATDCNKVKLVEAFNPKEKNDVCGCRVLGPSLLQYHLYSLGSVSHRKILIHMTFEQQSKEEYNLKSVATKKRKGLLYHRHGR